MEQQAPIASRGLMNQHALKSIKYNENEIFRPFYKTFLSHIKNMGWGNIMAFNVGVVDKDLATHFGEAPIDTIETFRQTTAVLSDGNTTRNILKCKFKAMYTYLLNLIDQHFKRHFTLCINTHKHMGPFTCKVIINHLVKNNDQTIHCALYSTHIEPIQFQQQH